MLTLPVIGGVEPAEEDFVLYKGATFNLALILYSDTRLRRWRGEYNENYLYEVGDGVLLEGDAYIATASAIRAKPGTEAGAPFWTAMDRQVLTGYTMLLRAQGNDWSMETTPTEQEETLQITIEPGLFVDAPTSARYFVKFTAPSGVVTYPLRGTLLFREP